MESTTQASQSGGLPKTKPALPPKPGLTPKPFSLQTKSTIRSISAPKTAPKTAPTPKSPTPQTEKSEAKSCPTNAVITPAKKLPQPTSASAPKTQPAGVSPKSQPEATKASEAPPQNKNGLGSETVAPDPTTKTTPPKEELKSESVQKDSVIQTNHKTPSEAVPSSEQKDGEEKQSDTPVPVTQMTEESSSNSFLPNNSVYKSGSTRKRLPKELTSKFESGGVPLPPQPSKATFKPITKDDSDKPESSDTQQSPATTEPPIRESDAPNEDFTGGNSIKKRISRLFDSVSQADVPTKREDPEILNGIGGVKEQIKNWAAETGPEDQKVEKKPQAVARVCSKSFQPVDEKSPETSRLEVPSAEETATQPVDAHSTVSSPTRSQIEPPKEARTEDKYLENATEAPAEINNPKEDDIQPQRNHVAAADEKDLTTDSALKKKRKAKRRSVRFGTVVADDGGPPLMLGPEPESSEHEKQKEDAEAENKEEAVAPMPIYRRVGIFQRKDEETQIQETLKHQQFEQRQKEEESEQARLKMKEAQKQIEEEEEMEKEKAKQKELEKKQLEEEKREMERLREEKIEKERQMELLKQRQIEEEINKEKLRLEEEKRKEEIMREERKRQRQKEEEERLIQKQKLEEERREKELELLKQRKEEEERLRQEQMEQQKLKQEAEEKEKLRRLEEEEKIKRRELEEQRTKELELMRQRKEEEERLRREQMEQQQLKQEAEEKEKLRRLEEEEKIKRREIEEQRTKELELLRQRKEEERLRQEQMEQQKLKQEAEEKEKLRRLEEEKIKRRELEEQRTKELELLRQRKEEEERLRQEQMEQQKLKQEAEEKEKIRRLEEEKRLRQEDEERKRKELGRIMEQEKEQEEERKMIEKRKIQMEKEKAEELKRKMQEDLEKQRAEEPSKKLRADEENDKAGENLINFDTEDYSQKSKPLFSPSSNISENTKSPIDVIYDDFSVQNPLLDVDFDDFSVKSRRWTPLPRLETAPISSSKTVEPVNKDNWLVSFDSEPRKSQQEKLSEQAEKTLVPTPVPDSPKKERLEQLLIDLGVKEKVEEQRPVEDQFESAEMKMEEEDEGDEEKDEEKMENGSEVEMKEDEDEEEEDKEPQVYSYSINNEDNPIEALFHSEPPQEDGISEQTLKPDSPTSISDPVPDVSSEDVDCTDSQREPDLAPFPEISTPLLDTSTQRSKAVLSRRRTRSRPSRSLRLGSIKAARVEFNIHDAKKGAESNQNESDSEEEPPKSKPASSPPTSTQKVPMFPGLSPAALLAGIKKKTGAAGAGTAKDRGPQEKESQNKEVASSASQISGSPRLPAHLAGAARVLPPNDSKDGSAASSPAWLKELKSKKRMSQHNGET